jgi:hypothetical protein
MDAREPYGRFMRFRPSLLGQTTKRLARLIVLFEAYLRDPELQLGVSPARRMRIGKEKFLQLIDRFSMKRLC